MKYFGWIAVLLMVFAFPDSLAAKKKKKGKKEEKAKVEKKDTTWTSGTFSGLKMRSIGPALTEGRLSDLVVHPENKAVWYITIASGGVWKTINAGTTWKPVFDSQPSYSIGCIAMDPSNPLTLWVGTGENNSQRSVAYGDGVYRSLDGGKTWKNMGLKETEHIGKIIVHPEDSNTVYVAAQGPLWKEGGERGLYKTSDGGESWELILEIDEHTGVNEVVMDPRDPNVLYASAYQRRRHVWTLINGGPGSGLHKSTDAGKTWRKINRGLPGGEKGRIGLAIAPTRPDTLYAIVEAAQGKSGFYRSTNMGESWSKMSSYVAGSPQYYQEIIVDPHDADVIYSNDTFLMRSEDGGKNFSRVGNADRHVDDHVTWIDPDHQDHLLVGGDGGLYETWDRGKTWLFRGNLPIVQFYKISTDNAEPFYNVFGGTQDNYSLAGPSRTTNIHGIRNADWFVTNGGDGFETQVDPTDPNTIYAQSQYGNLTRFDKRSGENIDIQPQPAPGEEPLIWNWDSPLLISHHSHKRIYFSGNRVFRSDDKGNSWKAVSPNLSRGLDRNTLPVMGRVFSVDAVSKNRSTSVYGNIVSFSESPKDENYLIAGTDDGLIHITEDGGANWRKLETFPDIPEKTYVVWVLHSAHNADRIYALFNNHKMGDFKPYILRSDDRGASWNAIQSNLPERGSSYALVEDHEDENLLFTGTEFGVFFTRDGGGKWIQLKSGIPTIAVRDLEIQRREQDLVVGTFGRGIYILDDYTPLRHITEQQIKEESVIFPVKDAWAYIPSTPLGRGRRGFQGSNHFSADNPPVGAVFTYYINESLQTRQQKRRKEESKKAKKGEDTPYPSWDELLVEDREEKPGVILTVKDSNGEVVRRLTGRAGKGFTRVTWDLRYASPMPVSGSGRGNRFGGGGMMVAPGTYSVTMGVRHDGVYKQIGEPLNFEVKLLPGYTAGSDADQADRVAFQKKFVELYRAVQGANRVYSDANTRLKAIKQALMNTAASTEDHQTRVRELETRMADLGRVMYGDSHISRRNEATSPSLNGRIGRVLFGMRRTTGKPTQTQRDAYEWSADMFENGLAELKQIVEVDLKALENELESAGAPHTPGRFPTWKRN